ncbi:TIGR04053 family radical SAM/SPASM domain-containing protein [Thermococcus waiotapuensis]|uniref:TIGR04053 family radical SAM/SPASM domain-containing protein n=1 Tax=Thermococcus waiotapuensis TaxID=90909 RepID=A0AAE4NWU1_9EURY|nr:TIGR04053 family radical SAM/SPASM domain-containing protein [Thermococcus waiotapuensis]MDV3103891.1 TIGR04053 family radical SAM/SPASM domain-containing protein [Thermococcus waiotapuensis]
MSREKSTSSWPYDEKPFLVFWETTKACQLKCKHCRAEAIFQALLGELTTEEGKGLIDSLTEFGRPYPILILTGGDPLMRKDIFELIEYAVEKGIRVGLAPAVTPLLTEEAIDKIVEHGVKAVSISLDSPFPEVHDAIRGIEGTWERTVWAIKEFLKRNVAVQVNTVVMRETVEGLPEMVKLLKDLGVEVWEVFYLVPTGRGNFESDLRPEEWEDVTHFLYEASKHLLVRTTEGPMFRRVAIMRKAIEEKGINPDEVLKSGELYLRLKRKLVELLGEGGEERAQTIGTRDGRGIVFIAYNGDVFPSGFLPYSVGNVREKSLVEIYRESELMKKLRSAEFGGRCGVCEFKEVCGGSRARAYAYHIDPLAEDQACPYEPGSYLKLAENLNLNLPIGVFGKQNPV